MDFSGWFLVNILGPTLLPVLGTLPFLLFSKRLEVPRAGHLVMATVKDGQMCWAVIAMAASTIYEIWLAHGTVPFGGAALVGGIVLMLPSMVVAAFGAVFSTPLMATPAASTGAWVSHYRVFVGSAAMALLAAADYIYVHVARGL
jgi:hypothetical protein